MFEMTPVETREVEGQLADNQRGKKQNVGLALATSYVALVLAIGTIVGTGLVPGYESWYSKDLTFRRQTHALQGAAMTPGSNPAALTTSSAWAEGRRQQLRGLGVPLWRLPFETAAKVLGQRGFPDRLALAAFMALTIYWVLRGLAVPSPSQSAGDWLSHLGRHPQTLGCVLLLALAPPFLALCQARFGAVEENAAYSYLFAVGLFAATIRLVRRPSLPLYGAIGAGSALIGFFAHTALAAGTASILIAFYHTKVAKWRWRKSLLGLGLFCLVALVLFATNYLRFGSGFESGQSLALDARNGVLFASRFSSPFTFDPLGSAAKELFSLLFLAGGRLNGEDWYRASFIPGQSSTIRWRELNFTTYDIIAFGVLILAWGLALRQWWTCRKGGGQGVAERSPNARVWADGRQEWVVAAAWSFLTFAPLPFYYLRHPFISSTALLDFAPAIGAAALACVWAAAEARNLLRLPPVVVRYLVLLAVVAWWSSEVATTKVTPSAASTASASEIARLMDAPAEPLVPLPSRYAVGSFQNGGIRLNGLGWNPRTGEAASCVAFFVDDPEELELCVAPRSDTSVSPMDYTNIQAKVGLQKLVLASNEAVPGGRKLVFAFPEKSPRPRGLQVAFLGFVAPRELTTANSKFRLLGLRWRSSAEEFNSATLLPAAAPEGPRDPYSVSRARALAQAEKAVHPPYSPPVITNALPSGILSFDSDKKDAIVREGEPEARFVFDFTNTSSAPVTIAAVTASCGCTTADLPSMPWTLKPHAQGRIPITMRLTGAVGTNSKTVVVTTMQGYKHLVVQASVLPKPIEVVPPVARVFIKADASSASGEVAITNNLAEPLAVFSPTSTNQSLGLTLTTNRDGKAYELRISASRPPQAPDPVITVTVETRTVTLATSSRQMPLLAVPVEVYTYPPIAVTPTQIVLRENPLPAQTVTSLTFLCNSTNALQLSDAAVNVPGVDAQIREIQTNKIYSVQLSFPQGFRLPPGEPVALTAKTTLAEIPLISVPIVQMVNPPSLDPAKTVRADSGGAH
jgi:hypothetical protein